MFCMCVVRCASQAEKRAEKARAPAIELLFEMEIDDEMSVAMLTQVPVVLVFRCLSSTGLSAFRSL